MEAFDWIGFVQKGGAFCSPLLLAALYFLNAERVRLLSELKERDEKIETLAERVLVITTELRNFLFNERKAP